MSSTVTAQVTIRHYGHGFTITANGDVCMRIPVSQLKIGDIIEESPSPSGQTCVVIRKLESCEVIPVKLVAD